MGKVSVESLHGYQTVVTTEEHAFVADEPKGIGTGLGPDPYQLLLGSLGACTAMTLRMYARQKGWALEDVKVELTHERIHSRDCEDCEKKEGMVDRITVHLQLEGDLDAEQRKRLAYIATRCPVHKTLTGGPQIVGGAA